MVGNGEGAGDGWGEGAVVGTGDGDAVGIELVGASVGTCRRHVVATGPAEDWQFLDRGEVVLVPAACRQWESLNRLVEKLLYVHVIRS